MTLEERSHVRAALGPAPPQAGRRPGAAAQRAELRRGRGRPGPVPRQRRHHRATRRIRPAQGVDPSCVIPLTACCAGCSTSPPAWPRPTAGTSPTAPRASTALAATREDAALVGAALTADGRRRPARGLGAAVHGRVGVRGSGPDPGTGARPARAARRGRFGELVRRPATAALAVGVVLAGAGTAAANDWLPIFRTEEVAAIGLDSADLVALPDLEAYGTVVMTGDDDLRPVPDAATAEAESGLDVPEVDALPSGITGEPELPGGR